jgi:glutathione peroxidase
MGLDRRCVLALFAGGMATSAFAQGAKTEVPMSRLTAYAFSFARLDGGEIRLADFAGKPILVVNTASLCGYTPQYAGLQELWTRFHDRGLMIVGEPSNDFGGQEPGTAADITETANHHYGVTFPLTAKAVVKGPGAHPFYKWAAGERPLETPRWNFHKYLVGRDGRIAAVFSTQTDAKVIAAIARESEHPE